MFDSLPKSVGCMEIIHLNLAMMPINVGFVYRNLSKFKFVFEMLPLVLLDFNWKEMTFQMLAL